MRGHNYIFLVSELILLKNRNMKILKFVIQLIIGNFFCLSLSGQQAGYIFSVDLAKMRNELQKAPDFINDTEITTVIEIPDHQGVPMRFQVTKSSVLSPEMESIFPDFMTYSLQGVEDELAFGRIFISRYGLEGVIIIGGKRNKIEAVDKNKPDLHRSFLLQINEDFSCESDGEAKKIRSHNLGIRNPNGSTLRQYEMAIVCTGEFYQDPDLGNNNSVTAQAAVVNIVNLINLYWSSEMSVLFTIFSTPVIYTDPATDGMNPNASDLTMEAAIAIHTNWPAGGYDLGHALHGTSSGGLGLAALGVVCNTDVTNGDHRPCGRGWSGGSNQNSLGVEIMVHEVGHMFNAQHTFNGIGNNCNVVSHSLNTAYEIGSGTTIMSYEGNCQANNNVSNDGADYFHSTSLESIYNYITASAGCSTNSSSGNTPPEVDATICSGPYTIPKMTPFELSGAGSDINGDALIYIWEQIDEDGAGVRPTQGYIGATAGNNNLAPLFRSFYPRTTGKKRIFPSQSLLLANNYSSSFEPLPNVSRTLNFRLTAREVRTPYAGYAYDNIAVAVDATKGPLTVTAPNNTGISINAGNSYTVTWNVNNTNSICNSVNILLSVDGGYSFPYVLLGNTENDGTQSVNFPAGTSSTTMARVRIESACLTCVKFFDISDNNFTITSSCSGVITNFCNATPVTGEEGSGQLNLGAIDFAYGAPFTSYTLTASGDPVQNSYHNSTSPGTGPCGQGNYGLSFAKMSFKPNASGVHTFQMNGAKWISIYSGEFNSSQPCTNFIGSTAYGTGGSVTVTSQTSVTLNQCALYTVVYFGSNGTSGTVTVVAPSGSITYLHDPPSNPNYSYTYAAVNSVSDLITAVSTTANFTSLPAGSYCVYGMYYHSGSANPPGQVNPSDFVGKTFQQLFDLGYCVRPSDNCKPVTVTSLCSTVVTSSADNGIGSLRQRLSCNSEGSTITFAAGINQVNLTSSLIIDKNMTLQGTSQAQRPNIITSSAGITIQSGKTLTVQNVDIQHSGSQTINGTGTLSISGLTVGK